MTSVALSEDVELAVGEPFRVLRREFLQHAVEVGCHLGFRSNEVVLVNGEGVSCSNWVVDEEQVVALCPCYVSELWLSLFVGVVGPELEPISTLA